MIENCNEKEHPPLSLNGSQWKLRWENYHRTNMSKYKNKSKCRGLQESQSEIWVGNLKISKDVWDLS